MNDWKCKRCNQSGHKMIDCPLELTTDMFNDEMQETLDRSFEQNTDNVTGSDERELATRVETATSETVRNDANLVVDPEAEKKSGGLTSNGQAVRQTDGRPQQKKDNSNISKTKHAGCQGYPIQPLGAHNPVALWAERPDHWPGF